MGPRDCAERMIREGENGTVAAVFGPEKSGLHNDDLDLCHTLLTIPTDPGFSSLNLAMAVQVLTYELRVASFVDTGPVFESEAPPATAEEMEHFYAQLEQVHAAISFLRKFNLDAIKIDRKLISQIPTELVDVRLVKTLISLAGTMEIEVVAVGVEQKDQLDFLRDNGCKLFQGYYFAKPQPAEALVNPQENTVTTE